MFDIIIPIARKDFNKLRFVTDSILKNVTGFHNIYCISDVFIPKMYRTGDVQYFLDEDVLDFDISEIYRADRRGWYKQQFIKLFQGITLDNYLVVDGDVYINKPMEINITHPYFLLGKDQHHLPYFRFMKDVFGLERCYPHSFISETMFFKRGIIHQMLEQLNVNKYGFYKVCVKEINKINDASGFSEYELYGNFVTKHHPDLYRYKHIEVLSQRKLREWTDIEIRQHIQNNINSNYDLFTMHSWI